ncbi:hypothetical protein EIN_200770 [Entamoeba invadens IP1]|uniref:Uncharacterized protein n=1 Tax=Entamoeba invadens IP1 TaxID=370355 RepID=L7FJA2_ENTIV|nr:hypothetical protein EIN_200770 [Entamoeba invadens IP1]ELP83639.1 hypothetical protein EIN_200770 [Entamoeba invadens IP1]|eukprot:XP_004182985.1 hypothetical protein EIN_200770 [Entamoeba invadens IP1]
MTLYPTYFSLFTCLILSFFSFAQDSPSNNQPILIDENETEEVITPICTSDFVAANMNAVGLTYEITSDCYSLIPKYKQTVKGYNLHSECYVQDKFLLVAKNGHNVSRCGQWLEINGSNLDTPVLCMVAGSFHPKLYGEEITSYVTTYIGFQEHLFHLLTAGFAYEGDNFVQVTVAETDFDIQKSPTLWVLDNKDDMAKIQIVDCNRPHEFIEFNNTQYRKDKNDIYRLPITSGRSSLNLVSFLNEKIKFENVTLSQIGSFPASSKFVSKKIKHCEYLGESQIFSENETRVQQLMNWYYYKNYQDKNGVYYTDKIDSIKPVIETTEVNNYLTFLMGYAVPEMMEQEYKEFVLTFKVNFNMRIVNVAISISKKIREQDVKGSLTLVRSGLKFDYYQNGDIVKLKARFDNTQHEFVNCMSITYLSKIGDRVELINGEMIRVEKTSNIKNCNSTVFDCLNTECTVDGNSIDVGERIWEVGCEPTCGNCRDGFVCTTMGKCVEQENDNMRSDSEHFMMIVVGIIILTLL